MAQKFNVEILVHHLRIGDEMYKKGQVITFPADVVKNVGRSVKILIELPETKTQRITPTSNASAVSTASNASAASNSSDTSTAPNVSNATSTKNEEKTTKTEDKK